jgi:hypothetical protein
MKRFLCTLSVVVLLLTGCDASGIQSAVRQQTGIHTQQSVPACAVTVVNALTSATRVVPGVFNCFSTSGKQWLAAGGDHNGPASITSDADFEAWAIVPPVMDHAVYVKRSQGVWLSFRATGQDANYPSVCLGIRMNADGKHVDAFAAANVSSGLC